MTDQPKKEQPLRVLVVDDDESWRDIISRVLNMINADTVAVATQEEAKQEIETSWFHFISLDIRLEDGVDTNIEGMHFLRLLGQLALNQTTHISMLSAYGTREQMRESFREHRVLDFYSKDEFDREKFREFVQSRITDPSERDYRVNLALDITYAEGLSKEAIAATIALDDVYTPAQEPDPPVLPITDPEVLAGEIEDLLCRLFYERKHIHVKQVIRREVSGAQVWITSQDVDGFEAFVTIDRVDRRRTEYDNYGDFVNEQIPVNRHFHPKDRKNVYRVGGILYEPLDDVDHQFDPQLIPFMEQLKTTPPIHFATTLDRLVLGTFKVWHKSAKTKSVDDLVAHYAEVYGVSAESLQTALADLSEITLKEGRATVEYEGVSLDLANPLAIFDEIIAGEVATCPTYGQLDPEYLYIDENGTVWLTDFSHIDMRPVLYDNQYLSTRLRLKAISMLTFDERVGFEQELNRLTEEDGKLEGEEHHKNGDVKTHVMASCDYLQQLSKRLHSRSTQSDEVIPMGLLFSMLQCIADPTRYSKVERLHAFVSASYQYQHIVKQ